MPGRIKDYIALPKPNGYQSLHTTIFTGDGGIVEVQIRTEEMHRNAEYGVASHISYKECHSVNGHKPAKEDSSMSWFKQFLPKKIPFIGNHNHSVINNDIPVWIKELVKEGFDKDGDGKVDNDTKSDFFAARMFIFTPKGDVVDLPIESSPIDFAYAIHSDIGHHVSGAKVNGKLVSLDTMLKNGDIVEVITKNSAKPSPKWIDMAKTTMAKRHIRNELDIEEKKKRK